METRRVWGLPGSHCSVQFSSVAQSCDFSPLHGLQHARLLCPSPTPRACSNTCPSSQWCHPNISSSVVSFSSCLQSFSASGSFPRSQFVTSGGQSHTAKEWQTQVTCSSSYSNWDLVWEHNYIIHHQNRVKMKYASQFDFQIITFFLRDKDIPNIAWDILMLVAQPVNHLQDKRPGFDPWIRKILWRRQWLPSTVFLPENSMHRGTWWTTVPGVSELYTTEQLSILTLSC